MKFEKTKTVLARNLRTIARRVLNKDEPEPATFANAKGLKQRSLDNAWNQRTNSYRVLDQLSEKLDYAPWQLLYPADDPFILELLYVYTNAGTEGKRLIRIAVIGAKDDVAQPQKKENNQ